MKGGNPIMWLTALERYSRARKKTGAGKGYYGGGVMVWGVGE